ncbi:MAG: biotin--[acetyl-CoA-carboxylase] ligase [Bacteroidetes bacterium]|nr:biotin--[acetyl-CoA-carboxylase] ligase [Bacteroidota bacterium]
MKIIKLSAIGSTNDYLKQLSKEITLEDGSVVYAEDQISGRGQRGAKWHFEKGKSLAMSVFKCHGDVHVSIQFAITIQVSLSILSALKEFDIPKLSVKWPNDIMSDGKKLAGILIENQLQGMTVVSSIIGVGINVNNSVFVNLPRPTSMFLSSGQSFKVSEVLHKVAEEIINGLNQFSADHHALSLNYENQLYRINQVSTFSSNGHRFNGIIKGVNPAGELLVELEHGKIRSFRLKELTFLS